MAKNIADKKVADARDKKLRDDIGRGVKGK